MKKKLYFYAYYFFLNKASLHVKRKNIAFLPTKEPYRDPYNISTDKQIETLHQKSL